MAEIELAAVPFLSLTGGQRRFAVSGATVGDALHAFCARGSGLTEALYSRDGHLRRYVSIHLNGVNIRDLDGIDTPVSPEDTITVTMILAGG